MPEHIPVGKITRIFGNEGAVIVKLYDNFPLEVNLEGPLFVVIDKLAVPLYFESFRRKGSSGAVVAFEDIDSVARAAQLIDRLIVMGQEDMDTKNEMWIEHDGEMGAQETEEYQFPRKEFSGDVFHNLVGFKAVVNVEGNDQPEQGEITGFVDIAMNPLLSVVTDDGEILIPAIEDYITGIDTIKEEVTFVIPSDLRFL